MRTFLESATRLRLVLTADTPIKRYQGLMHHKPLAPNEGALFIYDFPTKSRFWNKNVSFPIQIGFFDNQHKLIDVQRLDAHQITSVGTNQYFRYALETSDGFFDKIPIGTLLDSLGIKPE